MTLLFNPNLRYLIANRGIVGGLSSSITVFGGAQPLAADLVTNWASYGNTALLHYTGATWTHPIANTALFASLTTLPAAATALATGAGSWAVLWGSAVTQANLQNATIPNASFVLVPVTLITGNGAIRFSTTVDFVSGLSYAIADGTITVGST